MGTSFSTASRLNTPSVMAVAMMPGATAFTVTPRLASSIARDFVAPWSPALAAA